MPIMGKANAVVFATLLILHTPQGQLQQLTGWSPLRSLRNPSPRTEGSRARREGAEAGAQAVWRREAASVPRQRGALCEGPAGGWGSVADPGVLGQAKAASSAAPPPSPPFGYKVPQPKPQKRQGVLPAKPQSARAGITWYLISGVAKSLPCQGAPALLPLGQPSFIFFLAGVNLKFKAACQNSITPEDYTKIIKVVNSQICSKINGAQQRPSLSRGIKAQMRRHVLTSRQNVAQEAGK